MKTRLINIWDNFHSSFWFVPTLMAVLAFVLAIGTCQIDEVLSTSDVKIRWLTTTAPAARSVLSSLAGAAIALAGVVFSITVVTLSIASSQFGSRILRNVMTDSIADLVIGQFVGTSLYCLLVLRTVRNPDVADEAFVPHVATAVGLVLGVISLMMLIWYIHHVAIAIQAPKLVEAVARELNSSINRIFSASSPDGKQNEESGETHLNSMLDKLGKATATVSSNCEGYIEGIDRDSLTSLGRHHNAVIAIDCKPGGFVTIDQKIARIWLSTPAPEDRPVDDRLKEMSATIESVIIVGGRRTPRQDVGCAVQELVEIAVRALSPGINDPFTAINCVDRLGAALGRMVVRTSPNQVYRDSDGSPRLLFTSVDNFRDLLGDSFNPIRQYGAGSVGVSLRMLRALSNIAERASRAEDIEAIHRQADSLRTVYTSTHAAQADLEDFDQRYNVLVALLNDIENSSVDDDARTFSVPTA